ncbi:N-6 DNA methylase [Thermobifida halotolerans]|uniref:N-6 DNA methylase n=1 Tax=Thermobifida halotolerans TaxID=483545 RepID=A0A399G7R7_9ACTN|nr:N-6 DNA methylase [Thermobifida halotolerans]UOE20465.1 N-6 DNA methylase [Thermobifida halotolerans]
MQSTARITDEQHVTAADIARLAGVTRAAVSNWRRRHDDFPDPVGGTKSSPLFALSQVRAWLERQDKGYEESDEVRLWHALRGEHPESMVRGVCEVAEALRDGAETDSQAVRVARKLSEETSPAQVLAALVARLRNSPQRGDTETSSTARLVRAVARFAGDDAASVFDPACGIGSLLLAVGGPDARRAGQEVDPDAARLARLRAEVELSTDAEVRVGDSLRADRWTGHQAELVVCDPPTATADWGREELLLDPRWELGLPPRAEAELAWLQHAYAHTAPGGRAVVVMSTSAAYRRTGRRIRADLVRRGLLTEVVALPAGMAAAHAQPVHLWLLRRPETPSDAVASVRMTDLSSADPDGPLDPAEHQRVEVPLIDLLDDRVDLTPGRHTPQVVPDHPAEYAAVRAELREVLAEVARTLPELAEGSRELGAAQVRVADLVDNGLAEIDGDALRSTSDRLDTDFLNGFLRSAANTRRSTSASGVFRTDARSARVPQMDVAEQHRYGAAFRSLEEFERQARRLAELASRAAELARDGLTSGALTPEDPER